MYTFYIEALQRHLQEHADPKTKDWWTAYIKQGAPFRGVKMSVIRSVLHQWYGQGVAGDLSLDQQKDLALALFRETCAEDKLAGILFLQEILIPAGIISCGRELDRFAELFSSGHIYDWNICDWFCVKVLGPLIQKEGDQCANAISEWRSVDNLWQARASVVAFVPVAENSVHYVLIRQACEVLVRRHERFAKTAVGWILRDISKYDEPLVKGFIEANIAHFSRESVNNALKYFSEEERDTYKRLSKNAHVRGSGGTGMA